MCLEINKEFKNRKEVREFIKNPLIAKKDIHVFKVISKDNTSIFKPTIFKWKKGFHYYQTGKKFTFKIRLLYPTYLYTKENRIRVSIHRGLHSVSSEELAIQLEINNYLYEGKIVKMVIPKGSEYFEKELYNGGKYYVSDQLIYL